MPSKFQLGYLAFMHPWTLWNKQGFIPSPTETELELSQRVSFCLSLRNQPLFCDQVNQEAYFTIIEQALQCALKLYGIYPDWVPIILCNQGLFFWHSGCATIFYEENTQTYGAFLQLSKRSLPIPFSPSLMEILSHEYAHIGRMTYQEKKFEELLAYRSSPNWRRIWSPLFETQSEMLFLSALCLLLIGQNTLALFYDNAPINILGKILKGATALSFFIGLVRLYQKHTTFNRCLKKITTLSFDAILAEHLVYRLRDEEISFFARHSLSEIKQFIKDQISQSFRWQFLAHNYPFLI